MPVTDTETIEVLRRRIGRCVAVVLGAVACLLSGVACERAGSVKSGIADATLSIGMATPEGSLDLGIGAVANLLSAETLLTIPGDGRPRPNLIERWERSEDGLTWRFHLRKGIVFHDGRPLNAERTSQVLRALVRNPDVVATAPSFQQVVSIEPVGEASFMIRLNRPSALLLSDLGFADLKEPGAKGTIGTGPFEIQTIEDKRIVLRRFDRYRDGVPPIQRVELHSFRTVRNAWAAMMRGEVDFLYEVGSDAAEFVENESSIQTFSFLRAYTLTLGFNLAHPVLRSKDVRQALNRAIDRNAIVRSAFRGRGRPADGPIWPDYWAFSSAVPTYTYNTEAAALGFANAGYRTVRLRRSSHMPSRFQFRCLVLPELERVALMIQKQLVAIDVDMAIELATPRTLFPQIQRGDYDSYLVRQLSGRTLTWPYLFWHSPEPGRPVFIATGYSAADAALDRARYAMSDEDFRTAVAAFQQAIHDDPPAVFIAWDERLRAVSRRFHVPRDDSGRDVVAGLWRWKPATDVTASRP